MDGRPSSIFFIAMSLWVLQTSMPVLDDVLPMTPFPYPRDLSVTMWLHSGAVLSIFIGLCNIICFYCLFSSVIRWRSTSPRQNVVFLIPSYFIATGIGMHCVCVILEKQLVLDSTGAALIDFLHEYASHTIFTIGLYATLGVIMFYEYSTVDKQQLQPRPVSQSDWVWSLLLGNYLAILSFATGTQLLTMIFFITVLCFKFKVAAKDMEVYNLLCKTSVSGLPIVILLCIFYMTRS